jgi:predicted nucleic acid-binding protein
MILDTNAVSDFADANQCLLNRRQESAADIHLPVIALGEYRYGVKSSRLRAPRESWLDCYV